VGLVVVETPNAKGKIERTISAGTCGTKFNNLVNFGGYPHVPLPETAF
jgi:hypothetical protein